MKLKVLKPVLGHPSAKIGDIVEIPDGLARKYISLGLVIDPNAPIPVKEEVVPEAPKKKRGRRAKNGRFTKAE